MRTIIFLVLTVLSNFCIVTNAEQFSFANAAFQARLQSVPVPQGVNETTNEYLKGYRDFWEQVDSWPKGEITNGLFCMVQILPKGNCCVYVANITTNDILGCLRLPIEAVSKIDLFDQQGKPVVKTDAGKQFTFWTQKQIKAWYDEMNKRRWGRRGFRINAMFYQQISGDVSLTQLFQINQPGEYTLHVSVLSVKSEQDKSGNLLAILLPEVIAKVQIRSEDIPSTNSIPSSQTNLMPYQVKSP